MAKEINLEQVAEKIVIAGFQAEKDEDTIKGELFAAKIPFSKINGLYKKAAVANNLIVDPAVVATGITEAVAGSDWDTVEDADQVAAIAEEIVGEVKGSTVNKVIAAIRKYYKETLERDFPKKVKKAASRARGGKAVRAISDCFLANKQATKQDCFEAVLPHVKGAKNATDNVAMFYLITYSAANACSIDQAYEATKDQTVVVPAVETPAEDSQE